MLGMVPLRNWPLHVGHLLPALCCRTGPVWCLDENYLPSSAVLPVRVDAGADEESKRDHQDEKLECDRCDENVPAVGVLLLVVVIALLIRESRVIPAGARSVVVIDVHEGNVGGPDATNDGSTEPDQEQNSDVRAWVYANMVTANGARDELAGRPKQSHAGNDNGAQGDQGCIVVCAVLQQRE